VTLRRRLPCTAGDRRRVHLALALFAVAWLLDQDGSWLQLQPHVPIVTSVVFAFIWAGIQALASYIAVAAEITAEYVWIALQWLAGRVGTFLRSSGAMFAKVWDATKIVWKDVLKPALVWIDDHLKRLHDWLQRTFRPVFNFLKDVRERLLKFYTHFVRPVLDTIDFIRAVNRVLLTFHIHVLQALDKVLQQIEQRIEEPILWLNQQITRVWNLLDLIITFDGLYQRVTLLKSLRQYEPHWFALWWNDQVDPNKKSGSDYDRTRIYPIDAPFANGEELSRFARGEPSRVDEAVATLVPYWREAVGLDPPSQSY